MSDIFTAAGGSQAPSSPANSGKRRAPWWQRAACYVLLACAVIIIADLIWEGVEEGKWKWYKFGTPLLFTAMAIAGFANVRQHEEKWAREDAAKGRGGAMPKA